MSQKVSGAFVAASWVAMGSGMIGFLVGLMNAEMQLNEKVIELSKEPSDTPVDTNKFSTEKNDSTPDFRKMTKRERILYNITK